MIVRDLEPHLVTGDWQELFVSRIRGRNGKFNGVADTILGAENWQFGWRYNNGLLGFLGACHLYKASYDRHFHNNPDDLDAVTRHREVFDMFPEDVKSGTDFTRQNGYVHIQDIAIRALVAERGREFTESGDLLQIRSTSNSALGVRLSPFNVDFIAPDAITENPLIHASASWKSDSVEAFYQANRRLLVRNLPLPELFGQRLNAEFGNSFSVVPVS